TDPERTRCAVGHVARDPQLLLGIAHGHEDYVRLRVQDGLPNDWLLDGCEVSVRLANYAVVRPPFTHGGDRLLQNLGFGSQQEDAKRPPCASEEVRNQIRPIQIGGEGRSVEDAVSDIDTNSVVEYDEPV